MVSKKNGVQNMHAHSHTLSLCLSLSVSLSFSLPPSYLFLKHRSPCHAQVELLMCKRVSSGMVGSVLHGLDVNTVWVKLVNRCRLLCVVMCVSGKMVVVAGERGERMMVVVGIEDVMVRLRTHTL